MLASRRGGPLVLSVGQRCLMMAWAAGKRCPADQSAAGQRVRSGNRQGASRCQLGAPTRRRGASRRSCRRARRRRANLRSPGQRPPPRTDPSGRTGHRARRTDHPTPGRAVRTPSASKDLDAAAIRFLRLDPGPPADRSIDHEGRASSSSIRVSVTTVSPLPSAATRTMSWPGPSGLSTWVTMRVPSGRPGLIRE